jgi:MraZ protein
MEGLFHGSELCTVDADGSVALPGFLTEMMEDAGEELLIAKHESDACLIAYRPIYLLSLADRIEARRLAEEARGVEETPQHYRRMRHAFGLVDRLAHSAAALRIPPAMRHLGRIDGLALFIGTGERFEIWNPELALASEDQQFRDLAAFRLQQHASQGVH